MLTIDLEYKFEILYVRLKGNLNKRTSYKINNYLAPLILKHKIKYLVYNCENLKEIDNSGVDAIISTKYLIRNNKGKIKICNLNNKLKDIFKRIKISSIDNEDCAVTLMEAR